MSKIKEFFQSLVKAGTIPQEPMNYDALTLKVYIDHLEAEIAALKKEQCAIKKIPSLVIVKDREKTPIVMYRGEEVEAIYKERDGLQAENERLKQQIASMVTPPCRLGDVLYIPHICFRDGISENDEMTHDIAVDIAETMVDRENYYQCCHLLDRQRAFFSKQAAQKNLQEMIKSMKE